MQFAVDGGPHPKHRTTRRITPAHRRRRQGHSAEGGKRTDGSEPAAGDRVPSIRCRHHPGEVEVWWAETDDLVVRVRSSNLYDADALIASIDQLQPADSSDLTPATTRSD